MLSIGFYWEKQGLIFKAAEQHPMIRSHAQIPTVLVMKDKLRIFYSTRSQPGQSLTTFIDVDTNNPKNILYIHDQPIIPLGEPGTFDEHGVMPSDVHYINNQVFLYYSGWSKRCSVPYNNLTGLAISDDDGLSFTKIGRGPILSNNIEEPFSATSPCVIHDGKQFRMFYCSGTDWHKIGDKFEHVYDIKQATSDDGIHWQQDGKPVIPQSDRFEALTRPSVFRKNNLYHMFYCFRGSKDFRNGLDSYKIGYAYSHDLESWIREDKNAGIELSAGDDWDSKMLSYPYIVQTENDLFMFYNGNGFGQSGLGYAILRTNQS